MKRWNIPNCSERERKSDIAWIVSFWIFIKAKIKKDINSNERKKRDLALNSKVTSKKKKKKRGENESERKKIQTITQFECHFFIITQLHNNPLGLKAFVNPLDDACCLTLKYTAHTTSPQEFLIGSFFSLRCLFLPCLVRKTSRSINPLLAEELAVLSRITHNHSRKEERTTMITFSYRFSFKQ